MKKDKPYNKQNKKLRIQKRYSEKISSAKPLIAGLIAALCLFLFYSAIMLLSNSVKLALLQFYDIWYWIVILMFGFGTQVGLFIYLRELHKQRMQKRIQNLAAANASVTGSATISGSSMVACCAHHLTDLLPILGFSAFALFLNKYQTVFILVGVFSNIIGMLIMLRMLQKFNANFNNFLLKNLLRLNLKFAINVAALLGIITIFTIIGYKIRT